MEVHNLMEDLLLEVLDKTLEDIPDFCKCNYCRNDIIALVLNNMQPKYVATDKGYVYSRAEYLTFQAKTDIVKQITNAVEIVRKNPRHD